MGSIQPPHTDSRKDSEYIQQLEDAISIFEKGSQEAAQAWEDLLSRSSDQQGESASD